MRASRLLCVFAAVLSLGIISVSLMSGETMVTLNPAASPATADPGVTSVTITGHGFPSGTIPAANVTVTLNPATVGGGPSGSTAALSVTVVSGNTERVTFRVPRSIAVTAATAYEVSISGTTSTGTPFASSNTAALTVNAPVTITTASPLPAGAVGSNYSEALAASGGSGSYTWAVSSGSLPGGLTLSSSGVISGQPTATGTSHFAIKATDSEAGTATKTFALTVNPALVITTSSPLPTGTVGVNYAQTLTATGGSGSYTWSVSAGALPAGLTLAATTGVISGQPTAAGTPAFTIQVTDSNGASTAKGFTVTINAALVITTNSPLPTATVGVNYSQTLAASGGSGSYTWSVSAGALPAGLTLAAGTGVISGQPTTAGTPSFTIQATDTNSVSTTKPFSMTVNAALTITTTSPLPTGTVGVNYSQTLAASGGSGSYTWSVSAGALPAGLTLAASTGVISGQPTTAGTPSFTIQVTDTNSVSTTKPFSMTVNAALTITTTSPLPTGTVGVNYSQTLAASGGSGSYTWSVSAGALPAGLTLAAGTGVISGQPTTAGAPSFTIQVTDTNSVSTTKPFSMTVNAALTITTTSPLPTGTVGVSYSQTLAATGGSGSYTWSVSAGALPAGLTLAVGTGVISGQPTTAGAPSFTIQVTDTNSVSTTKPFSVTIDPALVITTTSPLPAGEVNVSYSDTLSASGGSGSYTWSISAGTLPAGLTLTPGNGLISGTPTTAATSNFTIQVTDTASATTSLPVSLTVNPAAQILSVSPNLSYQGLPLMVTITGQNTHFVQGTTQASFGPGTTVGGGTAGQPGPVTVNSATSAVAQVSISATAPTGSQTVTVTTGGETASLTNGFTIETAIPNITLTTSTSTPLAPGFSGFSDEYLITGVEYWDPKYLAMVEPLQPGFIRFPAGSTSMVYDWETAHINSAWVTELEPDVNSFVYSGFVDGQQLTQAKGGACFYESTCVSDYATFLKTLGANGVVDFNGYTDTNTNSMGSMASTAQTAGMNIIEWELDNEPYVSPKIFATAADYLNSAYNPYYLNLSAADPSATAGVFYQGQFVWQQGNYVAWDDGMAAYTPQYWNGVSMHVYPITDSTMTTVNEEQTLNGVLAYGTTEYFNSYVVPLLGSSMPVFFTELNTDGFATMPFESYIYNGIFLAEWIARMSTIPQIKAVGVQELYLGNSSDFNQGIIRAVNDYESYLKAQVRANPNYSTNTATNPNTQFQFYYSTSALALEVANPAINGSNGVWNTTVNGGPTVPIQGYNGNPIPAVYAQGYQGTGGTHYLVITNKSGSSIPMAIVADGNLVESTLTVTYVSSTSDTAQNTATDQNAVQIQTTTSANPITVGPYSVTRVQW
ncbi:MAG: putative Ig domain-containing protein [Bryobacteraceae bacterium]|jgi:hypothetical protein